MLEKHHINSETHKLIQVCVVVGFGIGTLLCLLLHAIEPMSTYSLPLKVLPSFACLFLFIYTRLTLPIEGYTGMGPASLSVLRSYLLCSFLSFFNNALTHSRLRNLYLLVLGLLLCHFFILMLVYIDFKVGLVYLLL
ncbi:hypothetical protein GMRT_21169 [Giardia muris]|uniref:Uncharacterized protein n=1 Tax=Giardia muris TaxID=5742 RepID=A0A4Z1SXU8_GIAMU|nr:hypothetical protein GMRT_21169 [Giardia muris]|eukprot:TNJ30340.1 hypothetical protein GMRT_21169 [Giardia muris]